MSSHDSLARAQRAAEELTEVQASFDTVRRDIFEEIAATDNDQTSVREALFLEVRALDRVRSRLTSVINGARMIQHRNQSRARGEQG